MIKKFYKLLIKQFKQKFIKIIMNFLFNNEVISYHYLNNLNKQTILFLHGWGGNENSFLHQELFLKNSYNILSLTMPTITPTITSWQLIDYVNLVENLLNLMQINKVIIICHSFGFRVASLMKKSLIEKIVVTGGAGIKTSNKFKMLEHYNTLILLKQNRYKFLYQNYASSDYKILSDINKITFKNIVNFNTINFVKFNCPMLLFWGKNDIETKFKIAKILYKKNKCKLIKTNGNHFAYIENSVYFNNCIKRFLNEN